MISETIIIPVIIAFIELLKGLGLPKKFGALTALVLGVVIGVFYANQSDIKARILMGAVYGLSASGLYSGTKNTIEETRNRIRKR